MTKLIKLLSPLLELCCINDIFLVEVFNLYPRAIQLVLTVVLMLFIVKLNNFIIQASLLLEKTSIILMQYLKIQI